MCATEIATKLRRSFIDFNESQIWGSIEPCICGYDYRSCRYLVNDACEAEIFARAESLSRGVPLPTNPEFISNNRFGVGFLFCPSKDKRINTPLLAVRSIH